MTEQKQVIPEGYKQTEIGVIPDDWEICELGDAVEFLDGLRRPVKSGDRAKIRGIYPYYGASGIVDYVNDYLFDDDLILLGEDGENILSRNLPLAFRVSGKIWVNNHAHVMKPKIDFHIGYLTDFLESLDYALLNSGTAQPKLNKQTCLKIKIIKPGLIEQTVIANALSDVDALISELEKLIAKKQAIKTATMQQLLTGKTRLPEFAMREDGTPKGYKQSELGEIPEDWECCNLSELYQFKQGIQIPVEKQSQERQVGYVRFIRIIDLTDDNEPSRFVVDPGKHQHITENDLFMVRYGIPGLVGFNMAGVIANNLFRLFPRGFFSNSFYFHYLGFRHKDIIELSGSSTMPAISFGSLANFPVLKFSLEEQTAIAIVLSDINKDIQLVEQRLNKTNQIKQGMMQELLTGKTRLVKPEVTA